MINKRISLSRTITSVCICATLALVSACGDSGNPLDSQGGDANNPPVLTPIGERYASVNNAYQLLVRATDAESTPSLTALNLPTGNATFVDSGNGVGLLTWTPMPIHANSISAVTFVATDDSMSVDSEVVALNVINYSFSSYVGNVFTTSCSCHNSASGSSGFSVISYSSVLAGGNASTGVGVVPGDTTASIVLQKIGSTPPFGSQMPLTGPPYLAQSTIDSIAIWILAGAPNTL